MPFGGSKTLKVSNQEEDPVEPHMIPEEAIIRSLNHIRSDTFYLIVYIRAKTD